MIKKIMSVLVIFAICLCFISCHMENRFGFSELMRRMEHYSDEIVFNTDDAFFSKGEWFVFLSLAEDDDIIITAKEDEKTGYITTISISTVDVGNKNTVPIFIKVCEAAADAFIFGVDDKAALEGVGLYGENVIFSEETFFYETGRFSLSFFNAEMGSTLLMEIT